MKENLTIATSTEQPERGEDKLARALRSIAEASAEHTAPRFLKADGSINMEAFKDMYSIEEVRADRKLAADSERLWSGIEDEDVRRSFKEHYGFEGETEEDVTRRLKARHERMKKEGTVVEMLATLMLHKALGDQYVVARTTPYDDYQNGIDTIIVNRVTGEVVGAFDETHTDERGEGTKQKRAKLLKKLKRGGGTVKYGFSYKDGSLVKKKVSQLPIFYVALTTADMRAALASLDADDLTRTSPEEQAIIDRLLDSFREQTNDMLNEPSIPQALKRTAEDFSTSLLPASVS